MASETSGPGIQPRPNTRQLPSTALSRLLRGELLRLVRLLRSSESIQILACAACGCFVGAMVAGLHWGVNRLHQLTFQLPSGSSLSAGIGVNAVRILVVPAIGGALVGILALVYRHYRQTEVVDPIEANALHGGQMSVRDSTRLLVATVISNAAGASVGMEAGYSQIGAGIFSFLGRKLSLRRADQRIFVGAGAAAAIAAAFNAPLAGAFYAYELILGNYSIRALAPVAVAALAGAMTERAIIDPLPLFVVPEAFQFKQSVFLLFGLLGILSAGFAVLTMQSVTWAERAVRRLPAPSWLRPVFGGVVLSAIAFNVPQVLGSGHGAIQYHFDHNLALLPLVVLLMAKLAGSAVSIGSGYRGGLFSAALFLGCIFGAVFSDVASFFIPRLAAQHDALMMVGMGAVAASVVGAPLTMVFLVLEGTGDFPITVGVMVGVVIASTIVRLTFGYSFSTWRFHQRGLGIRSPHDVGWVADMTVGKLMRADPKTVEANLTLSELRALYPLGSAKRVCVVGEGHTFLGIIGLETIHDTSRDAEAATLSARALAKGGGNFLLPGDNVRKALLRFEETQSEMLAVVKASDDPVLLGYLTEAYALRRYSQELERRRSAELGERELFPIAEPGS